MPLERARRAWHGLDGRQRAAIVVWVLALVLLGGKALLWPHRNTVYPIFAEAGRRWLTAGDLYEPIPGQDAYRYGPPITALLVLFGLLPDGPGGLLWRLTGSAVFCGGLAWWGRIVLPPGRGALLFLLTAPLTFGNIHNGQANVLIMGLLLLAVAAVAGERFNIAALCLAVACLFKLYPIAIGLLLAALFPRRLAPRLVLLLAVGLLLPFLFQRPGYVATQYAGWVEHLAQNDRQMRPREFWYRDARLLWSLCAAPLSSSAYLMVQAAGAAVAAGVCLWARRAGQAQPQLLALLLGLGCCWMTALGPATESSTYLLLGPTAAWLLLAGGTERHPIGLRVLWLIAYALLVAAQAVSVLPGGWGRSLQSLGPQPMAALLILGGLLYLSADVRIAAARLPVPGGCR
jgi:Glycosyltransferase family 87